MAGSAELVTMRKLGANPMICAADGDSQHRGSHHASAVDVSFGHLRRSCRASNMPAIRPIQTCQFNIRRRTGDGHFPSRRNIRTHSALAASVPAVQFGRALPQKDQAMPRLQLTTLPSSTQSHSDLVARYKSRSQRRSRRNSDTGGEMASRARTVPA
jgi:hypothetical protein